MVSNIRHATPGRWLRAGLAVATLGVLAACSSMSDLPAGTPLAQIQAKYGRPNFSCPEPDGGQHLVWSQQPFGQYAWGVHVNSAGQTDQVQSLLTDEHFQLLGKGTWTQQQVLCEFGPPALKDRVGLPSSDQLIWSYRYRQAKSWNSLMYVYFGHDGSHVTRFHPGPDPMFDDNDRSSFR
ncbi:hypothetical protein [Paralcaligenes ginsengisoli]